MMTTQRNIPRSKPRSEEPRRLPGRIIVLCFIVLLLPLLSGCTTIAIKAMGGVMESLNVATVQDEDPEFVRDALPMGLKLLEAGILQKPKSKDLLLSACSGFTAYAHLFVVQPADFLEDTDLDGSRRGHRRAGRLFLRARGYCLRALNLHYKGMAAELSLTPEKSVLRARKKKHVPLLFWTAASWAGAINVSLDTPDLVADLGAAHELLKRTLALDPTWDDGAIHELLIALEAARDGYGGSIAQAREHFQQARSIGAGKKIGALVSLAESVSVKEQNVKEFRTLLEEALAFDLDSAPEFRLVNTLAQRRARWLTERTEDLFLEVEEP